MIMARGDKKKQLYFLGNSLSNQADVAGSNIAHGYRYPLTCYASLIAANPNEKLSMQTYAVPGILTQTMIDNFTTLIKPYITSRDIIIHWGIVTDLVANGGNLTAEQAEAKWDTMMDLLVATGAKVISCTMIACDSAAGGNGDLETNRLAVNTYIKSNTKGVTICDLAADSIFDTISDASNATYYIADKIHLTNDGYDTVAGLVQSTVQSLL